MLQAWLWWLSGGLEWQDAQSGLVLECSIGKTDHWHLLVTVVYDTLFFVQKIAVS